MSEDLHDIDDIFKSAIEPMEESPSERVWKAVDSGIDKFNIDSIRKKYNVVRKLVLVLVVALLAVIVYTVKISNNFYKSVNTDKIEVSSKAKVSSTEISGEDSKKTAYNTDKVDVSEKNKIQNADIPVEKRELISEKQASSETPALSMAEKANFEKNEKTTGSSGENSETQKSRVLTLVRSNKARTSVKITLSQIIDSVVDESVYANAQRIKYFPEKIIIEKPEPGIISRTPIESKQTQYNAESSALKSRKKFPLSATLFFSPSIVTTSLRDEGSTGHTSIEEIREGEIEHISFTTGLLIEHPLNRNWSIESGVMYSAKNSAMKPRKIFAYYSPAGDIKYKFECSLGYWYVKPKAGTNPGVGDSIYSNESTMFLKYISVPLSVKYNWPIKRFTLFATAGTSLNVLLNGKIKSEIENSYTEQETNEKIYGLRKSYFSGIVSAGVEYRMTKRFSLSFSPSFNFAINSVTKDIPVKSYLNSLGISGGVKVKF